MPEFADTAPKMPLLLGSVVVGFLFVLSEEQQPEPSFCFGCTVSPKLGLALNLLASPSCQILQVSFLEDSYF